MSPLALRRYRAERLLREDFERLRERVISGVRRRLAASGTRLDETDLEACYAQAWQGLYTAVLEGAEIANPPGWLAVVTFRRAIEEHRARLRVHRRGEARLPGAGTGSAPGGRGAPALEAAAEHDLAAQLDDRMRIRQLFEGLRGRLNERELQAAALCYLQGLSRSEAAARMGVSEARMRKLMEGRGPGRPGVAGKVGALVETIRAGTWCEEQGSLMRGLAYGILDPAGERHRLALIHQSQCPACRADVVSLRGLAALLPPAPWLVPWLLPGALSATAAAGSGAGAGASAGATAGGGLGAGAVPAGGVGGALSASGAAGAGAAGGGWLLAGGPVGAKLAVGCLLALGVGAGCVELTERAVHPAPARGRRSARVARPGAVVAQAGSALGAGPSAASPTAQRSAAGEAPASGAFAPAGGASREFGPERPASGAARSVTARAVSASRATATLGGARPASGGSPAGASSLTAAETGPPGPSNGPARPPGAAPAAQREFAPG